MYPPTPAGSGGARQRRGDKRGKRKDCHGVLAAGPIRPSLPWCFSPATGSLDPSCARRKPAARRKLEAGSAKRQVKARFGASF